MVEEQVFEFVRSDIIRAWSSQKDSYTIDLNSEIVINLNDSALIESN